MRTVLAVFVLLAASVFGTLRADISGPNGVPDGRVDLCDLAVLAAEWLESETCMGLGDELVANGTFDSDLSGWTPTAGVTWNDDGLTVAFAVGAESEESLTQSIAIVAGRTYQITLIFPYMSVGYDANESPVSVLLGGAPQTISNPDNSEYEQNYQVIAGSSNTNFVLKMNNNTLGAKTFWADNISVREVLPDGGSTGAGYKDGIWPWE